MVLSKEDLFLLKSITERDRDLQEMADLMRSGLDGRIILDECNVQDRLEAQPAPRSWMNYLAVRIGELEEAMGAVIPWRKEAIRSAELRTGSWMALIKIQEGYVRQYLALLEEEGKVTADRSRRPTQYRAT